jgi:tape measure domain-containing protein
MAKGINIIISAVDKASKSLKAVTSNIRIMDKETVQASQRMGVALAAAGAAAGALGLSMLKAAANYEQSQVAFTTMLGSAEKAKELLEDLTEFAQKTPFEIKGLEDSTKKLLAYGIEQEKILPTLESLGNIASGVGMDKLPNLTLAFGQVKAATKLTGMELRQFTEAGVPLLDELARGFRRPVSEIQALVSEGKVGFGAVEAALNSLSSEGGRFNDLMAKQSTTLAGKWSNLADAWEIFLRNEGAALLDWGKQLVDVLIKMVENVLPKVISGIKTATKWLGEHKIVLVAVGGYLLGTMIPAIVSLGKTLVLTFAATGPVGLAVAGLAAALYGIKWAIDEIKGSSDDLAKSLPEKELKKTVQGFTISVREGGKMVEKFSDTVDEWEKRTTKAVSSISKNVNKAFKLLNSDKPQDVSFTFTVPMKIKVNPEQLKQEQLITQEKFDELTDNVIGDIQRMEDAWGGFISSSKGVQESMTNIWVSFQQGVGNAVASAIIQGGGLVEAFKNLMKSVASSVISTLIQMGIERLALTLVYGTANLKELTTRMASESAKTYASAYASSVGIPVVGPLLAPGIASAAVAKMLAGATASAGLGAAAGTGIGALHGGLENVPAESTYLLQAGERVLSPRQNKELTDYLQRGGGGGGVVVNELNIMPGASIDEALFDKPTSWWSDLVRAKILPAMNSLGRSGHKTAVAYDAMAVG